VINLWELAQVAVFLILLTLVVRDVVRRHPGPAVPPAATEVAGKPLSVLLPRPRDPADGRDLSGAWEAGSMGGLTNG
jgi:hypothetical protein